MTLHSSGGEGLTEEIVSLWKKRATKGGRGSKIGLLCVKLLHGRPLRSNALERIYNLKKLLCCPRN